MSRNLTEAHTQWLTRPPDERFGDLESLLAYTERRKAVSEERYYTLNMCHLGITDQSGITVNGHSEPAILTNWSFNQLCSLVKAPARYLRTLQPLTVVHCLSQGIKGRRENLKLLTRNSGTPAVSAFTGPGYGRIWDADVVSALRGAVAGTGWHLPPARTNGQTERAGLYASDRDMFAFFVNDENPVEVGNAKLGRGFFCWNSETGSATFGLMTFLYNYVCGNHIVWGAEDVREIRIVHRSNAIDRFGSEAIPALSRFVESRTEADKITDRIASAMKEEVGDDLSMVSRWFRDKPFTDAEVNSGWTEGRNEGEDVSTLWGMVQGLTAHARGLPHINSRVDLERRAGELLTLAA